MDGRRLALIIGNDAYQHIAQLQQSENDGHLMNTTLTNLGFQTQVHFNLKNEDMKSAIYDFGENLRDNDLVFFYYSGHGGQKGLDNFIFGVDSKDEIDSKDEECGVSLTKAIIQNAFHKCYCTCIIVLDACRLPLKNFFLFFFILQACQLCTFYGFNLVWKLSKQQRNVA
eukprot:TRINITY_DN28339_c0_g1_i1.p2 TRINITY_DN28339_c0_g1~~TRINITY_DN28339_c0_g1_i1.p2  ORF type:complete len:193 (-),score=12.51 TRINITY_DN28339_c0_g1_i1:4-513(-)